MRKRERMKEKERVTYIQTETQTEKERQTNRHMQRKTGRETKTETGNERIQLEEINAFSFLTLGRQEQTYCQMNWPRFPECRRKSSTQRCSRETALWLIQDR